MSDSHMDHGSSKLDKQTQLDSERLAGINQAQKEMTAPSGVDIKQLVRNALSAYWKEEEARRRGGAALAIIPVTGALQETADLRRGVAAWIGNPIAEFFNDIAAVLGPVLLIMLAMYFVYRQQDSVLANLTRAQLVKPFSFGIATAAILLLFLAFIHKPLTRVDSAFIRHSIGALVGGIALSVMILQYTRLYISEFKHTRALNETSIELELERLAIRSIEQQRVNQHFFVPSERKEAQLRMLSWPIETTVGKDEATYRVNLDMNSFVAQVDRKGSGVLFSQAKDRADVIRYLFQAGTVANVREGSLDLQPVDGGQNIWVKYSDIGVPPRRGSFVVITMDAKTSSATNVTTVADACLPDLLSYWPR